MASDKTKAAIIIEEQEAASRAVEEIFDEARVAFAELEGDQRILATERVKKESRIQTMLLFAIAYELRRLNNA